VIKIWQFVAKMTKVAKFSTFAILAIVVKMAKFTILRLVKKFDCENGDNIPYFKKMKSKNRNNFIFSHPSICLDGEEGGVGVIDYTTALVVCC
jgi:hypothetical protein